MNRIASKLRLLLAGEVACFAAFTIASLLGCKKSEDEFPADGPKVGRVASSEGVRAVDSGATAIEKENAKTDKPFRRSVDLVSSWDEMVIQDTHGLDVAAERIEWATAAIAGAGSPSELEAVLAFLHERNEGDLLEWVYAEGLKSPFSDERAPAMRDWLAGLGPEDKLMAVRIGFSAGRGLLGNEEGLKGMALL